MRANRRLISAKRFWTQTDKACTKVLCPDFPFATVANVKIEFIRDSGKIFIAETTVHIDKGMV
jgi:hypothetical protein